MNFQSQTNTLAHMLFLLKAKPEPHLQAQPKTAPKCHVLDLRYGGPFPFSAVAVSE